MAGYSDAGRPPTAQSVLVADMASKSIGQSPSTASLVGRRVRINGNLATAHWGPGELQAPPAKKTVSLPESADAVGGAPILTVLQVVGVEYDLAGLGKHDGTYQDQRLFICKAGHGSFAKVDKVEVGVSLQTALAGKYFAALCEGAATKGNKEEVGAELLGRYDIEQRQKELEAFKEMSLADTNLETRYPEDVWQFDWSLPNLKSLWLDKTLLADWADILSICQLCPRLEWLSLARTRLKPLPQEGATLIPSGAPETSDARIAKGTFACRIQTLVLSSTGITWQDILALDSTGCFPCIEHLHLSQNELSEGVPELCCSGDRGTPRALPRLKTLMLDGNGVSDWFVLHRAIAAFPTLESLHLSGNSLGGTLQGLADMSANAAPRCLTSLSLNENRLSSWQAVGALSAYALLELKVQRNPLTEGERPAASPQLLRQVLVALMPTLTRLNASEVTARERLAAERYFLALAQNRDHEIIRALNESCNVESHAARLQSIYAEVTGEFLVEVTLQPFGAEILEQKSVMKKVPHIMTIIQLKTLAWQAFGEKIPLERLQLLLVDPAVPFGVAFADESRELGFYGVQDGARFRVDDSGDAQGDKLLKKVDNLEKLLTAAD